MSCETGRVVYVSDSVTPVLNQAQSDWLGSSLYDQLHPDDTEKLREQLSTSENSNSGEKRLVSLILHADSLFLFNSSSSFLTVGRMLDMKTGTVKKEGGQASVRMSMGARRSFICRMRWGTGRTKQQTYNWKKSSLYAVKSLLIFINKRKSNFDIVSNTYWTEAAQLYLILHQSCFSLKSDHQDLLRSVCFQKLYFHCSSAEEWSSSHIFWGAFIIHLSISIALHCIICLDHLHLILLRHIIGDNDSYLYLDMATAISPCSPRLVAHWS